ncbi:hypothetical protein PHLGIDRAFT_69472, partial [Phlebiopsis gigantea 11061_1 CR5-6]
PQLRTPPPLTAEGKPVVAPQERSFVQKYWMYFAIAFLAIGASPSPLRCVRHSSRLPLQPSAGLRRKKLSRVGGRASRCARVCVFPSELRIYREIGLHFPREGLCGDPPYGEPDLRRRISYHCAEQSEGNSVFPDAYGS